MQTLNNTNRTNRFLLSEDLKIVYIRNTDALLIADNGKVIMYEEGVSSAETLIAFKVDKVEELESVSKETILQVVQSHYEAVLKQGYVSPNFVDELLSKGASILEVLESEILVFDKN